MTKTLKLLATALLFAPVLMACGRTTAGTGPTVAGVYADSVSLGDLSPVVSDASAWWVGPPTFDVRPLNSGSRSDLELFGVTVRFAHVGDAESIRVEYNVWNTTAFATALMNAEQTALGTSLSGSKAGDQSLYYNQNMGGGPAPYVSQSLVRVGEAVITIVWARVDSFASTSSLAKVAVKAASRLKGALAGKAQATPKPAADSLMVAPLGPDLSLLGTTTLPVDVIGQILGYAAPADMAAFFHQRGVSNIVYGDYALNADTRMEVLTSGFTFSSPTGAADWITAFYGGSTNLAQGVYINYESDTGQYVAAFGMGNRGILVVCRSSAPGETAGRICESPLVRVVNAWRQALAG